MNALYDETGHQKQILKNCNDSLFVGHLLDRICYT